MPAPSAPSAGPSWFKTAVAGSGTTLAWSPDGQRLATTADKPKSTDPHAWIWAAGGTRIATLTGSSAPIRCVAWSPDNQRLASATADGTVRLWDPVGRLLRVLPGTDSVFSLAWSPDGTILATGATGLAQLPGVIRLWRPDGTLLHTLATHNTGGKFRNLAWSPDGTVLAAGADD